jgi:O-antigen biosynthesis protein
MNRPYLIWAPAWTPRSSGTRVLHLLTHRLNEAGEKAYLVCASPGEYVSNPLLNTPMATEMLLRFYAGEQIDPVVVYPDIVQGNPCKARHVVRYLLAPAGLYGGDSWEKFGKKDLVFTYRTDIDEDKKRNGVLTLPTFDPKIWYPPPVAARSGACYYAHKYDKIHGNKLLEESAGAVRLEGSWKEIAAVLRKSEVCYLYEMSEVAVTAAMCGCPVKELAVGTYWNGLPKGDKWDFAIKEGECGWVRWEERFKKQLREFILATQ